MRDAQPLEERAEAPSVLGGVDSVRRRAEDLDTRRLEAQRELERGLAAELDDHALRPLGTDHVQHILEGERLEVQARRGVVVGRHRLRVAVHHHRVDAHLLQSEGRMHAAVVELDPLPDAVRARAQDHDGVARVGTCLVLFLVGRVVVRGVGLELGGAGVDALVDGVHRAVCPHLVLRASGEVGDLGVGEPHALGVEDRGRPGLHRPAHLDDLGDAVAEPRVDARRAGHLVGVGTRPDGALDGEDAPVGRSRGELKERLALPGQVPLGGVGV